MDIELTDNQLNTLAEMVAEKLAAKMPRRTAAAVNVKEKAEKPKLLKISQFAAEFNVTPAAVHKWILQRKIFAQKIGQRIWRIPIGEIEDFKLRNLKRTKKDVFERKF